MTRHARAGHPRPTAEEATNSLPLAAQTASRDEAYGEDNPRLRGILAALGLNWRASHIETDMAVKHLARELDTLRAGQPYRVAVEPPGVCPLCRAAIRVGEAYVEPPGERRFIVAHVVCPTSTTSHHHIEGELSK